MTDERGDVTPDWIKKALTSERPQGKTQRGLAEALGVHASAVTHIITGKRAIKESEKPVIIGYFGFAPGPGEGVGSVETSSRLLQTALDLLKVGDIALAVRVAGRAVTMLRSVAPREGLK